MGRLTLNMLLSFAQFGREIAGERIRDKIAASKAKGMWMGGNVPLGYDVRERKLVVSEAEASTVRMIFQLRRAWLGRAVEGRARAGRNREQAAGGSRRRAFRRQALLSRRALPDAAELALSGQRRAQGENLPRPARGDHRAGTLAGCSGQARCRPTRAVDGRWRRGTGSVVGPDLR